MDIKDVKSLILLGIVLMALPAFLSAAKYAGEIFYLSPGVANQAMGNTGLTNEEAVSAAWWNPALLALQSRKGLELMHATQFEGLLKFNHIAALLGERNKMGLVITHIGIDDIAITKLENDTLPPSIDNQPIVQKRVNNNDLIAYFGISRSLRGNLHAGVTPKLAYRSMAEKTGFGFGADLGMLWQLSQKFRLGFVARDFFSTQIIWENGTTETALPSATFELGLRTAVTGKQIPVQLAMRMEHYFEGREEASSFEIGPVSADFHIGAAILPIPQLKIMTGYDIDAFTAGLGINISNIHLEYALKLGSGDTLGLSQRLAAGWRW